MIAYYSEMEDTLKATARVLKCGTGELEDKVKHLLEQQKATERELEELKSKQAAGQLDSLLEKRQMVKGVGVVAATVAGADGNALRALCDACRDKAGEEALVVVLGGVANNAVSFAAYCSAQAVKQGAHAGKLVKEVAQMCGGNGGGRPDFAMAGGKEPQKAEAAVAAVAGIVEAVLA